MGEGAKKDDGSVSSKIKGKGRASRDTAGRPENLLLNTGINGLKEGGLSMVEQTPESGGEPGKKG